MKREITLTNISINHIVDFNNDFYFSQFVKITPNIPNRNGMTCDSPFYDATLTFLSGALSGVSLNLLSSWIYDKYKENRIKKAMINGVEVDIENITPKEILAIFTKDQHVDPCEDDTKE